MYFTDEEVKFWLWTAWTFTYPSKQVSLKSCWLLQLWFDWNTSTVYMVCQLRVRLSLGNGGRLFSSTSQPGYVFHKPVNCLFPALPNLWTSPVLWLQPARAILTCPACHFPACHITEIIVGAKSAPCILPGLKEQDVEMRLLEKKKEEKRKTMVQGTCWDLLRIVQQLRPGDLGDESFQADTKFPQHFPTLDEREGVGARPSGHSVGAEPAEAGAARGAELQTKQNNLLCRPSPAHSAAAISSFRSTSTCSN